VLKILIFSKNINNKSAPKIIFFDEIFFKKDLDNFLTQKIDIESQKLALSLVEFGTLARGMKMP
jgi:hypothetical protein